MVDVSAKDGDAARRRSGRAHRHARGDAGARALRRGQEGRRFLASARIAGIMAAKKTHELIPLCHPLLLTKISVDFEPDAALPGIMVRARRKDAGTNGR